MKKKAIFVFLVLAKKVKMTKADKYIKVLDMAEHPEGGWYKEIYKSAETIESESLPIRYSGKRHFSSSIYFLLKAGEKSKFHKLKSDEIWYFHDGSPLILLYIDLEGNLQKFMLGKDIENEQSLQVVVPAGSWMASTSSGAFSLVGCNVAPAFEFEDFEIADKIALSKEFPQHKIIINEFI